MDTRQLVNERTHQDLPSDFFKLLLGVGGERAGFSLRHRCRKTHIHVLRRFCPLWIGQTSTQGRFGLLCSAYVSGFSWVIARSISGG